MIDGVVCSEQQKQIKGATKLKQQKATETKKWLLKVGAQLPPPVVDGVPLRPLDRVGRNNVSLTLTDRRHADDPFHKGANVTL